MSQAFSVRQRYTVYDEGAARSGRECRRNSRDGAGRSQRRRAPSIPRCGGAVGQPREAVRPGGKAIIAGVGRQKGPGCRAGACGGEDGAESAPRLLLSRREVLRGAGGCSEAIRAPPLFVSCVWPTRRAACSGCRRSRRCSSPRAHRRDERAPPRGAQYHRHSCRCSTPCRGCESRPPAPLR